MSQTYLKFIKISISLNFIKNLMNSIHMISPKLIKEFEKKEFFNLITFFKFVFKGLKYCK